MPAKTDKRNKTAPPSNIPASDGQLMHSNITFVATDAGSSPLPTAEQFALYTGSHPKAGDKILEMAENQQKFKHKADFHIVVTNGRINYIGLITNFIGSISPIVASIILALNGSEIPAAIVGGGGAIAFTCTAIIAALRAIRPPRELER